VSTRDDPGRINRGIQTKNQRTTEDNTGIHGRPGDHHGEHRQTQRNREIQRESQAAQEQHDQPGIGGLTATTRDRKIRETQCRYTGIRAVQRQTTTRAKQEQTR